MNEPREYYRRKLPHYQPGGGTVFITFRLVNSLPLDVIREIQEEKDRLFDAARRMTPDRRDAELTKANKLLFARYDEALAQANYGGNLLARPEVAQAVAACIVRAGARFFTTEAYCIMPNHVHIVLTPNCEQDGRPVALARITQAIKGASAMDANRLLGQSGQFWQCESYDHIIRDAGELERVVRYVLWNPVKAGLVEDWRAWPWSYARLAPVGF
jgi:REP element-mobilizing transposase RayT